MGGIAFALVAVPLAGAGIQGGDGPNELAAVEITGDGGRLNIDVTSGIIQPRTQNSPFGFIFDSTAGGDVADQTAGEICSVHRLSDNVVSASCPVPKDLDVTLAEPNTRVVQAPNEQTPFDYSLSAPKGGNVVVNFSGDSLDIKNGKQDLVSCSSPLEKYTYDAGLDDANCGLGSVGPTPAALTCGGLTATYVGTPGPDVIRGTKGDDVILALGGSDEVNARAGDDTVCGGPGPDTLSGGRHDDLLHGNAGDDTIGGGTGDNLLVGHGGEDDCGGHGAC